MGLYASGHPVVQAMMGLHLFHFTMWNRSQHERHTSPLRSSFLRDEPPAGAPEL